MFAGRYFATGYWPKAYWPGITAAPPLPGVDYWPAKNFPRSYWASNYWGPRTPIEVSLPAIHGGALRYEFPDHAADRITRRDIDEITIILAALEDLGYL